MASPELVRIQESPLTPSALQETPRSMRSSPRMDVGPGPWRSERRDSEAGMAERDLLLNQLEFTTDYRKQLSQMLTKLDRQLESIQRVVGRWPRDESGESDAILVERMPIDVFAQAHSEAAERTSEDEKASSTAVSRPDDIKSGRRRSSRKSLGGGGGGYSGSEKDDLDLLSGIVPAFADPTFHRLPVWTTKPKSHFLNGHGLSSSSFFEEEEQAHNNHHSQESFCSRLMLNPQGTKRGFWDFMSLLLVHVDLVLIPLAAFPVGEDATFFVVYEWYTRIFWTLDMPLSLLSGYVTTCGDIEMHPAAVARKYLKSWFLVDLLIVGGDWLEVVAFASIEGADAANLTRLSRIFRIVRMLRLLRLARMKETMAAYAEYFQSDTLVIMMNLLKLLIGMLGSSHLLACLWYSVGTSKPDGWVQEYGFAGKEVAENYVISMRWGQSQFAGGMDEVAPTNSLEHTLAAVASILFFLAGALFQGILTSSMTQLYVSQSSKTQHMTHLRRYLTQSGISKKLTVRVCRNAKFAMDQQKLELSPELASFVSEPLHVEINFEVNAPMFAKHPFFSRYMKYSPHIMRRVCHRAISTSSFAQGDIIFNVGETLVRPKMFIVSMGELLYVPSGGEPTCIHPGQWISEMPLWVSWVHRGVLTSTCDSRACAVDAQEFQAIVAQFHVHHDCDPWEYSQLFVDELNKAPHSEVSDLPLMQAAGQSSSLTRSLTSSQL
eukprot:TRINITY_DN26302_c0_g1_i2.p1 TRINITY_DN26302_c0_g1~~TRINITY_DN26302_c0_g1_i2.p1  ORF type:complete len:719 (-),score=133.42 TRINITY_DN26302_c0_g1_i2:16-2172(-)